MNIKLRDVTSMDTACNATAYIGVEQDRIKMHFETTNYLSDIVDKEVNIEVGVPSQYLRFTGRFLVQNMKTDHVVRKGQRTGLFTYHLESVDRPVGFLPVEGEFWTEDLVLEVA